MGEKYSLDKALKARLQAYEKKQTFVLTNGCFDILHAGHASAINSARNYGDILWIGINSDESVRKIKGIHRPINSEQHRAYLLSSLRCVDGVFIFDSSELSEQIRLLKPDVYVKSSDYSMSTINKKEKKALQEVGAVIEFIEIVEKLSTSSIIEKIIKSA